MTPKEKAEDLFHTCALITLDAGFGASKSGVKKLALVAVDEVLAIKQEIWDDFHSEYFEYWKQVRKEIEAL